jgi:hypothetical protein
VNQVLRPQKYAEPQRSSRELIRRYVQKLTGFAVGAIPTFPPRDDEAGWKSGNPKAGFPLPTGSIFLFETKERSPAAGRFASRSSTPARSLPSVHHAVYQPVGVFSNIFPLANGKS